MKRVTIADIARQLGISACAVSKVLAGKAAEGRIGSDRAAEIRATAEAMGWRPNSAARMMRSRCTGLIGVLLRHSTQARAYFPDAFSLLLGLDDRLANQGLTVCLLRIADLEPGPHQPRAVREGLLDGLVAIESFPALIEAGLPAIAPVLVRVEHGGRDPLGCVQTHDADGARQAAEALAAAGWRRLAWFGPGDENRDGHASIGERLGAVREVCRRLCLPLDELGYLRDADPGALRAHLVPDCGVIAYDIAHAQWLAHRVAGPGLTVGCDIGLACCDQGIDTSRTWPELARVAVDRFALGRAAGELLLAGLAGRPMPSQCIAHPFVHGTSLGRGNCEGQGES